MNAGKYTANAGEEDCVSCGTGKYASVTLAATTCLDCPANSNAPSESTDASDCICNAGASGPNGGACAICQSGTYKAGLGDGLCISCDVGFTSPPGSTSSQNCALQCAPGSFGPDGGPCQLCPRGKYKATPGPGACSGSCPLNSDSVEGSTEETDCKCNAGFTGPDGGQCTSCGSGKYKGSVGAQVCTECEAGKYQGNTAATGCVLCPEGKYSMVIGATEAGTCEDCVAGKYLATQGSDAEADCVLCAAGTYSSAVGATAETTCEDCAAGKYLSTQGNTAEDDCLLCAAGKFSMTVGAEACEDCSAGKYLSTQGNTAETDCVLCAAGKYASVTGSTTCQNCGAGKYLPTEGNMNEADCEECGAGKYLATQGNTAEGDCVPCSAGTYSSAVGATTEVTCEDCAAGKYLSTQGNTAEDDCLLCAAGKFSMTVGAEACEDCSAGKYLSTQGNTAETDCVLCAAGKYASVTGSTTCQNCGAGKYLPTEGNMNEADCEDCSAGKYLSTLGNTAQSDCVLCAAGKYAPVTGSTACQNCGAGKYLTTEGNMNEADCKDCDIGKYLSTSGNNDAADCLPCGAGKYSPVRGAAACVDCDAAKYLVTLGNDAETDCVLCPEGKFSPIPGATSCFTCPAGLSAWQGSTWCSACLAGEYYSLITLNSSSGSTRKFSGKNKLPSSSSGTPVHDLRRPNFDRSRRASEFRRRRAPVSDRQTRRFKQYLREQRGSQLVHLKYDVILLPSTRVLDNMDEVMKIACTRKGLSLWLMPGSEPRLVAQEFQLGAVVSGGPEWGCRVGNASTVSAFTRRVQAVSISSTPPQIELDTSTCEPFDAFEHQDIDIWSESDASRKNLRKNPSTDFANKSPTASTRIDFIDQDEQTSGEYRLADEIFMVQTPQVQVSLEYDIDFQFDFRFKIRAGTSWGMPTLFEFESWVDEQIVVTSQTKADASSSYSGTIRRSLGSDIPLFALPMSVGGIGIELGLFGDLAMNMETAVDSRFSSKFGIVFSRRAKYGARWDPDAATMHAIDEGGPAHKEKTFEWQGKVVAVIRPSIQFSVSLRLGVALGVFGRLGFELASGLEISLKGEFEYGLGNRILPPASQSALFEINSQDCQIQHEAEIQIDAHVHWLGVSVAVNPFGAYSVVSPQDLLSLKLLIACYASGGIAGETLDYERLDSDSGSGTFTDMSNSYVPAAPLPARPSTCVIGYDCPVQPGQCANGYSGSLIGHPCASGCAIGFGYQQQCQPSTCCQARSQYPPSNGEHSEVGSGEWTSSALTVPGGEFTEVRCNAGYELTGRNLGFQLLGTWPNCGASGCTSSCCYNLGTNHNQRPWDWPSDADYSACTNAECRFRQSIPADGSWRLEERTCTPISCGVYPAPSHATVSPTGARTFGQTVTISCNAGYELSGDARFSASPSCQSNGEFTSGKLCARRACGPFSDVPNGGVFPSSGALSGQRVVISCDAGYEVHGDDSILCDRGQYQITTAPSCERISCGTLQVNNGILISLTAANMLFGDTAEISCNAGYYLSRTRALSGGGQGHAECTAYGSNLVTAECLSCPFGSTSPSGSSEAAHCVCNAGFTGSGSVSCLACASGKYKSVTGTDACTNCPSHLTSPPGSDEVSDCDVAGQCQKCFPGTYSGSPGAMACSPCSAAGGFYCQSSSTAAAGVICPEGFQCSGGSNDKQPCPAGSFSAAGATCCSPCPIGTFVNSTGSTTCTQCPVGTYSPHIGAAECTKCQSGTYSASTGALSESSCIQCPAGKTAPAGSDSEQDCSIVGCDGVPNSGKTFDVCVVCDGDGITSTKCNCNGDELDECGVCLNVPM